MVFGNPGPGDLLSTGKYIFVDRTLAELVGMSLRTVGWRWFNYKERLNSFGIKEEDCIILPQRDLNPNKNWEKLKELISNQKYLNIYVD